MTQREDFFVQVTLTPEQARIVVDALDLFSRLHIGQFMEISRVFAPFADRPNVDWHLHQARSLCFPGLKGDPQTFSYGINGCPSEAGKISWDVLQVIRQAEAYGRKPEGGITVNFDDPLFVSNSTPRPTAKTVTILDRLADA